MSQEQAPDALRATRDGAGERQNGNASPLLRAATPLSTLHDVPIDVFYIDRIAAILAEHDASMDETKDCTAPTLFGKNQGHKEFTLTFPAGTTRENGLVMRRTTPFTIVFPDGYKLRAADLWPLHIGENDRSTTVLYLPH